MAVVLVVDHEDEFISDLTDELEDRVIRVQRIDPDTASVGKIQSAAPDLVLYNIETGAMPGHKIISGLQGQNGGGTAVLVVFLCGDAAAGDMVDLLDSGADDVLAKTIGIDLLAARVHALLLYKNRLESLAENKQVRLYKALKGEVRARPAADAKQPPHIPGDLLPQVNLAAFQRRLRECLKKGKAHTVSKMQFVSLVELRATFGDSWRYLASRVINIAEAAIAANLTADDTFTRQGEDGFLILFADRHDITPGERADMIADEIRVRLLGEEASQARELPIKVATLTEQEVGMIPTDGQDDDTLGVLNNILNRKMARDTRPVGDPLARFFEQITIQYAAVWNSQKATVSHYHCSPTRATYYGQFTGTRVLHGGQGDPLLTELDMYSLTHAVRTINGFSDDRPNPGIVVSIHYPTFQQRGEEGFREILQNAPRKMLERYLVLELIGLEEAANPQRVAEFADFLVNYSRFTGARCNLRGEHMDNLNGIGLAFLGASLSDLAGEAADQGRETLSNLYAFSRRAKSIGTAAYVDGVDRMFDLTLCMDAHVPLLSGLAISKPKPSLGPIHKWLPPK